MIIGYSFTHTHIGIAIPGHFFNRDLTSNPGIILNLHGKANVFFAPALPVCCSYAWTVLTEANTKQLPHYSSTPVFVYWQTSTSKNVTYFITSYAVETTR